MIHSLISVIYDTIVKRCSNVQTMNDAIRKSVHVDKNPTTPVGITTE